jgi:hypothetical protein
LGEDGIYWTYDSGVDVWTGLDDNGDSFYYTGAGEMDFVAANEDHWHKYIDDTEYFIDGANADITVTYPYADGGYMQIQWVCMYDYATCASFSIPCLDNWINQNSTGNIGPDYTSYMSCPSYDIY